MVDTSNKSENGGSVEIRSRKKEKSDSKAGTFESQKQEEEGKANTVKDDSKERKPKSFLSKLWTLFKYGLLVLALPTFLNFASLSREERELIPNDACLQTILVMKFVETVESAKRQPKTYSGTIQRDYAKLCERICLSKPVIQHQDFLVANHNPDGSLVAISKVQNLFMKCKGSGSPLVLLDAPTGLTSDIWRHIFSQTAAMTKVCAFDRAGLGFSDRPRKLSTDEARRGEPHTTEQMVEDMISLLREANHNSQGIILVGAGIGATNAQFLAQLNHLNVVGVVLVNPFHSTLFQNPKDNAFSRYWHQSKVSFWQMLHISAASGITRLAIQLGLFKTSKESLPEEMQWRQKFLHCKPGHVSSVVEEHYHANHSLVQLSTLSKIHKFPKDIPVSLTSTENFDQKAPSEVNNIWKRSIKAIVAHLPQLLSHNSISVTDDSELFEESSSEIYHSIIEMIGECKLKSSKIKDKNKSM